MENPIILLLIGLVSGIILMIVFRKLVLWYFMIDRIESLIHHQNKMIRELIDAVKELKNQK